MQRALAVSRRRAIVMAVLLLATILRVTVRADTISVAWDANPEVEVVGYVVYIGASSGAYTQVVDVGNTLQYTVPDPIAGQRYCFAVAAYVTGQIEGDKSAEVCSTGNAAPTLTSPGDLSSQMGSPVNLTLTGSDPEGQPVTYSASGLPTGLSLTASTGAIGGTPTTAGTFTVTISVSDGTLTVSQTFTWTITGAVPAAPVLLRPSGAISTASPSFEWESVATATQYRLWVDDSTTTDPRIQTDYTPAQAGCASAGAICRVTPSTVLAAGAASWSVRGTNGAGSGPWSGAMDFSVPDGRAPSVSIATPTSAATYSTGNSTIAVGGTASDDVGVTQVTWVNDRGGSGTASGTTSWSIASVTLQAGANVVTVTARDAEGNTSTDVVTITKTDTSAPTVTIVLPSAAAAFSTSMASVPVSGTATDDVAVTQVTWVNNRGGSGTATGTAAWAVAAVALQPGVNVITVTARDAAGNTSMDVVTTTMTDAVAPAVTITGPTAAATYSTTAATVALAGTASDAFGVTLVTWSNDRGGSGTASGTTAWSVASVTLQPGANVLTVTASDAAGNTATDVITVTETDGTAPAIAITAPTAAATYSTSSATLAIGGTASDAFGVSDVSWSSDRGGSGAASGTTAWTVAAIALQSGANVITVTARDAAGHSTTDSVTVTRIDGAPPTVDIASPAAGAAFSTSTTTTALAGTAADDIGVTQVTWANSRGGSGTAVGTTAWSVASVSLQPGANVVTVTARDAAGNTSTDTLTVTLTDAVAPTISISAPTAAATLSTTVDTVALGGVSADFFGVTQVTWTNDRGGSGTATGTTAWTVASAALQPGVNVITVTARDAAGNTSTDTLTLTRTDGQAPSVAIASPTANATYSTSNKNLALSGTASDAFGVSTVSWTNDRGGSGAATGTTAWSVAGIVLRPGLNTITITATDAAGNTGTDTITATYTDAEPPAVQFATPTAAASYATNASSIAIGGTATDEFGLTQVTWANDKGGSGTATGTASWTVAAVTLKAGTNLITVTARDAAGNSATATLSVVVTDIQAPRVSIATPVSTDRYVTTAATVTPGGTASDDFDVAQVTWANDRGGSGTATGTTNWTISALALQAGVNVITVTARDGSGNLATDRISVTSDGRAPTVAIATPTSAATHSTNTEALALGGNAADDIGVTEVTWANSRGGSGTATGTANWTIAGAALQIGANVITVTARDEAGNRTTATLTVTRDARAPEVTITAPTAASTLATSGATILLRGTAADDVGVTQVTWVNSRGGSGTATGTTEWSVPNVLLQNGVNVITVTARDAAGNTTTDVLTATLDTRAPTVSISVPTAAGAFATTSNGVAIGGLAADDFSLADVTWTNSRGGNGTASGTTTWSVARVALQLGANDITVTARDQAGNVATATVRVTATDTTAPTVRIHGPSPDPVFSTATRVINIEGTATDDFGVRQIAWANDRGGSGVASGTGNWIVGGITLQPGVNVIAVTALDGSGNSASDVIRITLDGELPVVSIVTPTPTSSYATSTASVALGGTASDASGIAQVTWATDRGQSGIAAGTTNWSVASVPLAVGANVVTVVARDGSGNTATASLTVVYADSSAPTVTIFTPTTAGVYATTAESITIGGTASDDFGVTQVTWSRDQGGEGVAFGTNGWSVSGIPLALGVNVVTVSARDAKGNIGSASVAITRTVAASAARSAAGATSAAGTAARTSASSTTTTPSTGSAPSDTNTPASTLSTSSPQASTPSTPSSTTSSSTSQRAGQTAPATTPAATAAAAQATSDAIAVLSQLSQLSQLSAPPPAAPAAPAPGTSTNQTSPRSTPLAPTPPRSTSPSDAPSAPETQKPSTPPVVTILSPAPAGRLTMNAATVALSGAARHSSGILRVTWATDRGDAGAAFGSTNWTIARVPLKPGATVITVTAVAVSGGASSAVLTVMRPDGMPKLIISEPTADSQWTTNVSTVALRGTATDNVTRVTWSSEGGASGTATGTATWNIASVGLVAGVNKLTVTAYDSEGRSDRHVLTITYRPRPGAAVPRLGASVATKARTRLE